MRASNTSLRSAALVAALALVHALPASALPYPARPVRVIVPQSAGGSTDLVARPLAQRLSEALGQQFVVDNRPGAGSTIGTDLVAKATPDGHTLLAVAASFTMSPALYKKLPFDPVRDFSAVTLLSALPNILVVHPALPVATLKELIALAKARPGQINYASSGPGGSGHLAGELFKSVTHTNLVHVPYRGAPPALNDLVAGQVQVMFGTMLAAVPHVRSGKVRAIAVTGPKRSIAVPHVPTFAEAGLPGYDASSWNGILVPAGTPAAIVTRLNTELVKILHTPNVLDRLEGDGPIPIGNTSEQFAAHIKAEQAKWGRVVRDANVRID